VLPVTMVPVRSDLRPAQALTVERRAGGASACGRPLRSSAATVLLLHLRLPTEELPVPAAGSVVRRTPEGLLGVRLDRMRPADRDLVIRWIEGGAGGGRTR
jgi:hypothetical protein